MSTKVIELHSHREFASNIFVVENDLGECLAIDPGSNEDNFLDEYLAEKKVLAFLLTHAHFDHFSGLTSSFIEAPVYVHEEDEELLYDDRKNASFLCYKKTRLPKHFEVVTFKGGETLNIGSFSFLVIHTPYHTQGSSSFYFPKEKILFSGDALFKGGRGRSDLYGGNESLVESTFKKFASLPKDTIVYCGHEENTTISYELRHNEVFLH